MQGVLSLRRFINIIHCANKSKEIIQTMCTGKAFDKIQIFMKCIRMLIKKKISPGARGNTGISDCLRTKHTDSGRQK